MANVRYPGTAGTTPGTITASDVTYDNTTSGLTADDVQEAIDEIEGQISSLSYDASDISYDNTTSGLTADDVQEALDEIDGNVDTLSGKVYKTDDSTETTIASDDLLPIYDTSATASKKITVANVVKATVSNPNLIDNPWFTVNQRGISSLSAVGYTADRWKIYATGLTFTQNSNKSITLERGASEAFTSSQFIQFIEDEVLAFLDGKTVTLSALINGVIYSSTSVINASQNTFACNISIATNISLYIRIIPTGNPKAFVCFNLSGTSAMTLSNIKAVKLELGSISTLALDTAPNYATELLKCQRYYVRLTSTNAFFGYIHTSDVARIILFTPVAMRARPTWTPSDVTGITINSATTAQALSSSQTLSWSGWTPQEFVIAISGLTASFTAGEYCVMKLNTAYIDLTADL